MKHSVFAAAAALAVVAATAGAADAQARYRRPAPHYAPPMYAPSSGGACPVNYHDSGTGEGCICNETVPFYTGGAYPGGNGAPPYGGGGYPGGGYGGGYDIHLRVPGVRVTGIPVNVPSGNVYVQGAPIYVQAPPVRVASPQIYLQRPQVYVQPSQVTVEPPTVHVAGCANGQNCEAVGTSYSGQE